MVRLTDRPDMTLDVYHGRKKKTQQKKPDKRINIVAESCAYTAEEIMESQGPILRMFRGGEGVGWPGWGGCGWTSNCKFHQCSLKCQGMIITGTPAWGNKVIHLWLY